MALDSGTWADRNSVFESHSQDRTTSGERNELTREFKAACTMAIRTRRAARAASSAVAGPHDRIRTLRSGKEKNRQDAENCHGSQFPSNSRWSH